MECTLRRLSIITLVTIAYISSVSFAQDARTFATKGSTELGGSISFQSRTPVSGGNGGTATTVFSMAPFIGYFVTDGFEIGLHPLGITSINSSGRSATQIMILAASSYNFKTEGTACPFIEALLGYTSQSKGSPRSGFTWGGRGGVKLAVSCNGLLNLGIQYLQITVNPDVAANRYGSNQLSVSAGFTVWF